MKSERRPERPALLRQMDWVTTLIPFVSILILCFLFIVYPAASSSILESIRFFLGDQLGSYYLILGLAAVICSLYMAFSPYGNIRLGNIPKPQYSSFQWGSMMFTAGLAADILFYSLCEWMLYANEPHIAEMGAIQDWAGTYPLFHWGPIPWSFYIILAVSFGFMIHVRKRSKQKYSEPGRRHLGKAHRPDSRFRLAGRYSHHICPGHSPSLHGLKPCFRHSGDKLPDHRHPGRNLCRLHPGCVLRHAGRGKAGSILRISVFRPAGLLFLLRRADPIYCRDRSYLSGEPGTEFHQHGHVDGLFAHHFLPPDLDDLLLGLLDGMVCGYSFLYRNHKQRENHPAQTQDLYQAIIAIFETMPLAKAGLVLLALTMIAFYATSFDALAIVASSYSYKSLDADQEPDKRVKLFWAILLMLLPIALIFSENSMANLQTVSIIAAFPIGFIIFLIVWSFFKDAKQYLESGGSRVPEKEKEPAKGTDPENTAVNIEK